MNATLQSPSVAAPPRSGSRRLPGQRVSDLQRDRLLTAFRDVLADGSYAELTVAKVIARARVSRKTFYDYFSDRDDCFLAAFDDIAARARGLAVHDYESQPGWRQGVRAALARLLRLMDEEPSAARLCIVETLAGRESVQARRLELLDELGRIIDLGRGAAPSARIDATPMTAEAVVGGVVAVLHARLREQAGEPLTGLLGPLMSIIVLPYLGVAAARREAQRAMPPAPRPGGIPVWKAPDPLEGLNFRLTYRTIRVLMAVAEHPGANNRVVAQQAGIVDQGQVSKLLSRLARLGLTENHGAGQPSGAANAWRLTPQGTRVERATRPR